MTDVRPEWNRGDPGPVTVLLDLLLPAECPGCGRLSGRAGCAGCLAALAAARPAPVGRPDHPAPGLPPCVALGGYRGVLRGLLLGYKERARPALAGPLGAGLAAAVAAATSGRPVLLVPVPATAPALRRRGFDHVRRLAAAAARALSAAGTPAAVCPVLRARPGLPDSAGLPACERIRRSRGAFVARAGPARRLAALAAGGGAVLLVDDVVTTGATLAAAAGPLRAAGVPVAGAAVLAATPGMTPGITPGTRAAYPDPVAGGRPAARRGAPF